MSFDRDLRAKEKAKYDERFTEMEAEAADWIAELLDRPIPATNLCETLRDGTILCDMASRVSLASAGPRIRGKVSAMPFMRMENIALFLQFAADKLGIPQHDLFQTVDLYEMRNPWQVVQSLHTFTRYAVQQGNLDMRYLGPKMATTAARTFTQEQLNQAKSHVNTLQYGKFSGSSNVVRGMRRDPAGNFH